MPDDKYCICCGENVPVNTITRDGNIELTCIYCGFVLDVAKPAAHRAAEEPTEIPTYVLTADDSTLTRDLLRSMLLKHELAREVESVADGQAFIAAFTNRLTEGRGVTLAILDLNMPVMDGITAARLMRTVESKFGPSKTPILFFSAQKSDEHLKRQLELLAPARYVNKGSDGDPEQLIQRIGELIADLQRPA